jgi:hypothetical protein
VAPGDPPKEEEVDADLPAVAQLGGPVSLVEGELLHGVWNGTRERPESDPVRRLELDRLDCDRGVEVDLGVVGGDGEILAPRQNLDPRALRVVTQIRLADHLEYEIPRRLNPDLDRAELVKAASPAEIEMEPPHGEQQESHGHGGEHQHAEADRDPEPGHRADAAKIA